MLCLGQVGAIIVNLEQIFKLLKSVFICSFISLTMILAMMRWGVLYVAILTGNVSTQSTKDLDVDENNVALLEGNVPCLAL